MARLTVNLLGLNFPTPILCGAGPQSDGESGLLAALAAGVGGLVGRTVVAGRGPEGGATGGRAEAGAGSASGGPGAGAVLVPLGKDGILSAEGPSAIPAEAWLDQVYPHVSAAARPRAVPVIASLSGTAAEVRILGPALVTAGAQALEFSTAYLPWEQVLPAIQALRAATPVPIIAKLTLVHGEDIAERAAALEPYVDAFTCMDRFGPVLDIDVEAGGKPKLDSPDGYGCLSGTPIHPIAVRTVFAVANRVKKPVIASGGAMTTHDVVEFLQAGAHLVQVTTGAILKGPSIYGELAMGLSAWLDEHAFADVSETRDAYRDKYGHGQRVVLEAEEAPRLAEQVCIQCGICGDVCYYDAIAAPRRLMPMIHAANCFQCGLCVSACPTGALSFRPREGVTRLAGPAGEVHP